MTRKKLEEYKEHKKRIEYLERKLDYENAPTRDKVRGSSDIHPFAPRSFTIEGTTKTYNHAARLKEEIEKEKSEAAAVKKEILTWTESLGEVERDIIEMIFISGMGFRGTGDIVGYTASNICKIIKKLVQ